MTHNIFRKTAALTFGLVTATAIVSACGTDGDTLRSRADLNTTASAHGPGGIAQVTRTTGNRSRDSEDQRVLRSSRKHPE